jgi:antitoxin VapB
MADDPTARIGTSETKPAALGNERLRLDDATPLRERLRPIRATVAARPPTGPEADKAFYDQLSGGL